MAHSNDAWYKCYMDVPVCFYGLLCHPCLTADNSRNSSKRGDLFKGNWCINCLIATDGGGNLARLLDNEKTINGTDPCACGQVGGCGSARCCQVCCCSACITCEHARALKRKTKGSEGVQLVARQKQDLLPVSVQPRGFVTYVHSTTAPSLTV